MKSGLLLLASLFIFSAPGSAASLPETIVVYPDRIICNNYIGVGVQWSAYPHGDSDDSEWGLLMTDEKWEMLYDRLDRMKPRFIRVIDQANWRYFKGLDSDGNPILSFENQQTRALFRILDYCQRHAITVLIGEWGVPGGMHDPNDPSVRLMSTSDMRWIGMIGEWMAYLINEKGYTCIRYYDFVNEPNGDWACTDGNFAEWALGVKLLHEEFESRGLADRIAVSGPGTVPQMSHARYRDKYVGRDWPLYASQVLRKELGSYNTHAYFNHDVIRKGRAAEYVHLTADVAIADREGKPFLLGEVGIKATTEPEKSEHLRRMKADGNSSDDSNMFVYDYSYGVEMASAALQSLLAGVDGMAAWDLDNAMHTKGDTGDKTQMKRWGFWNILGTELHGNPADENIRPWYYAWSWLCRFMPAGTLLLGSDQPGNPGCQLLAARTDDDYTFYAVNTSDRDEEFLLKGDLPRMTLNRLTYNESFAARTPPYEVKAPVRADFGKGLRLRVPAKTFLVLTTQEPK